MSSPPLCKNCGGGLPQHQEGPCWCRACMDRPLAERCREYVPRPPKSETKQEEGFGKKPPKPPKKPPKSMTADGDEASPLMPQLPVPGTAQRAVLDTVRPWGNKGCTDEEIALKMGLERRDAVAIREELVTGDLLRDSGVRRRDASGHENVAWGVLDREVPEEDDSAPLLVREDVYVSQDASATVLHAGATQIRLSAAPGDPVEVVTQPKGADPDQDGGPGITTLLVVEGSEEMYMRARTPFITPGEIVEMMDDLIAPGISALTAVKKDL